MVNMNTDDRVLRVKIILLTSKNIIINYYYCYYYYLLKVFHIFADADHLCCFGGDQKKA